MVAPGYASVRSSLAKSIGLGRKRSAEVSKPEVTEPGEPEVTVIRARRARGSKG